MNKNYYIILGIPADSTQTDIKAAYRRLAKEFHPDYFGKNQIPFQDIQEAYSTLSHPQKRKSYDDTLQAHTRKTVYQKSTATSQFADVEIEPLIPEENRASQIHIRRPEAPSNQTIRHSFDAFEDQEKFFRAVLQMMKFFR